MMSFIDSFNKQLVNYNGKMVSREKYKKAVLDESLKNAKKTKNGSGRGNI